VTLFNFAEVNATASYKLDAAEIRWKQNGMEMHKVPNEDSERPVAFVKLSKAQIGEKVIAEPLLTSNIDHLPPSRTIILNCSAEQPLHGCIEGRFSIRNFQPSGPVIEIVVEYLFEIAAISKIRRVKCFASLHLLGPFFRGALQKRTRHICVSNFGYRPDFG
jgi:hypothetical protein